MEFKTTTIDSSNKVLIKIVLGQFLCTTLWFAPNAVSEEIIAHTSSGSAVGSLTSAVQFGFILGTLFFGILNIADRYSSSKVFLISAILGSVMNATLVLTTDISLVLGMRFFVGFFLAGIYPVGMKIAADYHKDGLGLALGYLVGALVLGTAFPHLLKEVFDQLPWQLVIYSSSGLALLGGLIVGFGVGDGPYQKRLQSFDRKAISKVFKVPAFRSAALGYFGHMWELYAFWVFVPLLISLHPTVINVGLWSFTIIALGTLGCILGGHASRRFGSKRVASIALSVSMLCCLLSPFSLFLPELLFLIFLSVWGIAVVADSPQFSSIVANSITGEYKGTGLTIVNCIGFAITIISIQLVEMLGIHDWTLTLLAIGPFIGLFYFRKLV